MGKGSEIKQGIDIEQLLTWALRDQGLGWNGPAGNDLSWMTLGTRVDTSNVGGLPAPSAALWTDDDALIVRQAVDALPGEAAALVLTNGRTGLRPDWCEEGEGQWVHERDGRGRPLWDWQDPVNRTGEKRARMVFEGTRPELVRFHRAQYALWWEGLLALVKPLNQVMQAHEAIGPFAPQRPWELARPTLIVALARPTRQAN